MSDRRGSRLGLRAARAPLLAAVIAGAGTLVAGPATAAIINSECGVRVTSQAFAALGGDTSEYFPIPDGRFESYFTTWASYRAQVVPGNEPWRVSGATDANSLRISAGGMTTSPMFCTGRNEDSMRFFYRAPGVSGSALHVTITVRTDGFTSARRDYDIDGSTAGWAASPRLSLPDLRSMAGTAMVQVTFSAGGTPAAWQIDDALVDPWKPL